MIRIKEDVKQEIIHSLCNSDCGTIRRILDNINKSYLTIDGYLEPKGGFTSLIYIPSDCVERATKCSNNNVLNILIEVLVSIEEFYGDGFDLLEEYRGGDEFVEDDLSLKFVSTDISKIERLVENIAGRDVMFWNPGMEFNLDRDYSRLEDVLSGKVSGGYEVKLGNEYEPKLKISRVEVTYNGEVSVGKVVIYLRSSIYRSYREVSMDEWSELISKIKEIIGGLGDSVKPRITVKLTLYE